jgi:hypothetical protein
VSNYDKESGMNTAGLNGQGRYVSDVANHAALVLLSRLMAVLGVPVAGFIIWSVQADISMIRSTAVENLQLINDVRSQASIQETRLSYQETILSDHNIRIRDIETRAVSNP